MRSHKKIVFLAIGANLRLLSYGTIKKLFYFLPVRLGFSGLRVLSKSNNWSSLAMPYSAGPTFINCVFKCQVINKKIFNPYKLHKKIKNIETSIGKKNKGKNKARSIDIDILDYGGLIINSDLKLPHPRMHLRKFVVYPLESLDCNWIHPIYKTKIKNFKHRLSDQQIIKKCNS